jgi:L-serine dehydratase
MIFRAFDNQGNQMDSWQVYSVGGGALRDQKGAVLLESEKPPILYSHSSMNKLLAYCEDRGMQFWEYVRQQEGEGLEDYLRKIWLTMEDAIQRGLDASGVED